MERQRWASPDNVEKQYQKGLCPSVPQLKTLPVSDEFFLHIKEPKLLSYQER